MAKWTLEYGGVEAPLAEWGVTQARVRFENNGVDVLTLEVAGDWDGEDLFDADEHVILRRERMWNGTIWTGGTVVFRGEVVQTPRDLGSGADAQVYVVHGPTAWLREVMFGQEWYQGGGNLVTSHVWLNNGVRTDEQLAAVLNFAISKGMPAAVGTIDTLTQVLRAEARDVTCHEVVEMLLRWSPDAVLWVDYSADPPQIHCRRYANLPQTSVTVDGTVVERAEITPRRDLQLPGIVLNFEIAGEVDGKPTLQLVQQKYPPSITGFERRCLVGTFDLTGPRVTYQRAAVETEMVNAAHADAATRLAWWKKYCPQLSDARIQNLAIDATEVSFFSSRWGGAPRDWMVDDVARRIEGGATTYWKCIAPVEDYRGDPQNDPDHWELAASGNYLDTFYVRAEIVWATYGRKRMLVEGVWARWLEERGYSMEKVTVVARATYAVSDAVSGCSWLGGQILKHEYIATDAPTGEYVSVETVEEGETVPSGLAEFLWHTHQVLHWEGRLTLTEDEAGGQVFMGKRVNILGGSGRYANISAVVQTVELDVMNGQTVIAFGPPRWLGPADLVEYVRAWRTRRTWTNPDMQVDGGLESARVDAGRWAAGAGGDGAAAPWAAKQVLQSGGVTVTIDPADNRLRISGPGGNEIDLDVSKCGGRKLEPREVDVCVNGVPKKMRLICTTPY